jgi:hypothetical protein
MIRHWGRGRGHANTLPPRYTNVNANGGMGAHPPPVIPHHKLIQFMKLRQNQTLLYKPPPHPALPPLDQFVGFHCAGGGGLQQYMC